MSKARDLADLAKNANDRLDDVATSDGALSNRNLIINGAMTVAQRGTSVSVSDGSNEGYQSIDRYGFYFGNSAGGACTISQDTTVPSGYGFKNSYKVDVTTADTSIGSTHQIFFRQRIEAQDIRGCGWDYTKSDGSSKLTLSFWARSTKAGVYCVGIRSDDTSGNMYFVKEYTLASDEWKKVEIKIPSNSSLTFDDNANAGLTINWSLQAGTDRDNATDGAWNTADTSLATSNQVNFFDSTSNNFYLTGVQLELGDTATPFEHRSYGDELARCQRYFYKTQTGGGSGEWHYAMLDGSSSDYINAYVKFPVSMRATPSGTATHNGALYYNTGSGQTNFTPSGGTDSTTGFTEDYGRIGFSSITNNPGTTHVQKVGQWYCAGEFDAEL